MQVLAIFGILYGILVLIGLPVLMISHVRLRREVRELTQQLGGARADAPAPVPQPTAEPSPPIVQRPTPEEARVVAPPADPRTPDASPARNYVLNPETMQAAGDWLRQNWTLAIAAVSLILGGLFMVQYGVEKGLLTPPMRVLGALALGLALIAGGEVLRRRHGDLDTPTLRHMPSTLSGAGAVILFIAILSAHGLYGLIAALPALVGLAAVSLGAVLMGWLYGPVLSAIGLIGASAAPFAIGGGPDGADLLYPYFALVGLVGLAIDSLRRSAWVSAMALALPALALWMLWMGAPNALGLTGAALALFIGAVALPVRSLTPRHQGPRLADLIITWARPEFPTRLAGGGMALATAAGLIVILTDDYATGAALGFALLVLLCAAVTLWLTEAPALEDLALAPAAAFLVGLALHALLGGPLFDLWVATDQRPPESPLPKTLWLLLVGGVAITVLGFLRLRRAQASQPYWALAAATVLPAALLTAEFLWEPAYILGRYPWALTAMAAAALMVTLTERRARMGGDGAALQSGFFAATAILMIALAFFVMLTKAALTLALSVLLIAVILIERRWPMPPLRWIFHLGTAVIAWRLLADPGVSWALERATLTDAILSHLAPALAFAGALVLLPRGENSLRRISESMGALVLGLLLCVLLLRFVGTANDQDHWVAGLMAAIWFMAALAQLWRLRPEDILKQYIPLIAGILFTLAGLGALAMLAAAVSRMLGQMGHPVLGPPLLDSLALSFLPLAAVFGVGAARVATPRRLGQPWLQLGLAGATALMVAGWVWLEIRRLWRGPDLSAAGPSDGELYSYTVALMAASLCILAAAFLRRSPLLRKLAMAGVGLSIAKVFLIDMSGLEGLIRVASFVGLGLALTGLAWLNRLVDRHISGD
ncbi:DUF2339 domain-containing protein [Actibacterium ureilyticum]|uniref:DUF2339 domain-containing protein n=1 Tax=Actibacterium ureilyticum TaxID=1590614 RepID=UPI000BAA9D21|nr:DUF2339 domain-containing protein [Actibacterium ureilyticum]